LPEIDIVASRSEPSASLDPSAEKALFSKIRSLSTKRDVGDDKEAGSTTTIYISHRFSTGKSLLTFSLAM
jgi:ABC-type multidrug transport system fused ATPase/permease subunit